MGPGDDDRFRTESQRQWKRWAETGYAKRAQPTSMLWLGGIVVVQLIAGFLTVFVLTGREAPP